MSPVRIAVDVMSGDHGPEVLVPGVIDALYRSNGAFNVRFCGNADRIEAVLKQMVGNNDRLRMCISIDPCDELPLGQNPSQVWKSNPHSAIIRSIALQNEGSVDASISAGNSGVLLSASVVILGKVPSVSRPAIAALLPTVKNTPALLLDVGSSLESRSNHLVDFGVLGFRYMQPLCNNEPTVALLNVGTEADKGTATIKEAALELGKICKGYCGFIEGSDILMGKADVIVCDGFSGNVVLKTCESFHTLVKILVSESGAEQDLFAGKLDAFKADRYGAAPFLGINGRVFKSHGASSREAFTNAVLMAVSTTQLTISHTF